MPGTNVFKIRGAGASATARAPVYLKCVFISHKREDADMAQAVADSLTELNVNFWLDLNELGFPEPQTKEDHLRLTLAIEKGLRESTHLLALITPSTKGSWWVPFEIGICRSRRIDLAFLLHKEVRDLPSYFTLGKGLEDKRQFISWAEGLSGTETGAGYRSAVAARRIGELDKYVDIITTRK